MSDVAADLAGRGFGPDWSASRRRGTPEELQEWLRFALDCCDAADAIALGQFRRDMHVSTKPDRTLVTDADQAIERLIRERVADRYPDHGLLGEEFGESQADASVRWHLDPIDGTHNFIRGIPLFGTLLAVERDGELQVGVMSAPAMRERWYASRGAGAWSVGAVGFDGPRRLRVSGVAGLDDAQLIYGSATEIESSGRAPGFRRLLRSVWRERGFGDFWGYALVAEGAADGMVEVGVYPWDLAAPQVIIEEAGGRVTDFLGTRRIDGRELLASNGLLHDELLVRLRSE
jgi:histidinol-phosphatase